MAVSEVFTICNAYESGVGNGYRSTGHINPYGKNTDEHEAYELGYTQGLENRINDEEDGKE